MTQQEGLAVTLVCNSYGDPPPSMTFRKAGNVADYTMGDNNVSSVNFNQQLQTFIAFGKLWLANVGMILGVYINTSPASPALDKCI